MKDFINKPSNFNRIEFWAATTIFVFVVFFRISDALGSDWALTKGSYHQSSVTFGNYFFPRLIQYTILYSAFVLLSFTVVPNLVNKKYLFQNILLIILTYAAVSIVFGIIDTYLKSYLFNKYKNEQRTYDIIFQNSFLYGSWLMLMFGFYSVIKYFGLYLLSRSEVLQTKYKFITPGGLVAFVLWLLVLFILIIEKTERGVTAVGAIVPPLSIIFYWYSLYSLIPKSLNKKNPFTSYIGKALLVLLILFFPVWLLGIILIHDDGGAFAISFFNAAVQLFIIAPFSWVIFKRQMKGNEELYVLKKELGRSNANLNFLRSQINPHFLFNALNTIYGTAIQEKAERTSEGIEKLGDMMRFMLQENMQEKISLVREIEYLNNYIGLQRLRTDPNPIIKIEEIIEQQVHTTQIAPMLLIPFVENGFKHGISFREPSHIKVTLEVKDNTLYFDVYNSKHLRPESDPEKDKSGIGLNNVKQRLQLLYPRKHELIIRETGKEFFVHLTIQLS
jgi:hypothetical protein